MENKIERKLRRITTFINDIDPLILGDIVLQWKHNKNGFTNVWCFKGIKKLFNITIYWEFIDSNLYWLVVLAKLAENIYLELKGE